MSVLALPVRVKDIGALRGLTSPRQWRARRLVGLTTVTLARVRVHAVRGRAAYGLPHWNGARQAAGGVRAQARLRQDEGAARRTAAAQEGRTADLRDPEARRAPAALRRTARGGRSAEVVGGAARAVDEPGREAARGADRGPPDGVRVVRGPDRPR